MQKSPKIEFRNIKSGEYFGLAFYLSYRTPSIVFMSITGFLSLLIVIRDLSSDPRVFTIITQSALALSILFLVVAPLITYYLTIQVFKVNNQFGNNVNFSFNQTNILIRSSSVEVNLTWNDIQKLVELKHSILIYLDQKNAYYIPKSGIPTESFLAFIELVKSIKGLVKRLKR